MTHGVTAAFNALAVLLFTIALCLLPDTGARDSADVDSPVASSRRVSGIHLSSSAEPKAPVCNDVMPGASDVTAGVTNIAADQSLARSASVYDTPL